MQGLTIYKSSAGSGKTFTLVKEYLKLVLKQPSSYKHILGITFTNKAAGEMKNRIIQSLVELASGQNQSLENLMADELKPGEQIKLPAGFIQKQAKSALSLILHDYSGFSVGTIDSFFYKIIRAVSRELSLPLAMEIEMDTDGVIEIITDDLFDEIGENEALAGWMEDLALAKLNAGRGWKIDDEISSMGHELLKEQLSVTSGFISVPEIKKFMAQLHILKADYEKSMKMLAQRGVDIISSYDLGIVDFAYGKTGVGGVFQKALNNPENFAPAPRMLEASENPNKWYSKTSDKKEIIASATEELLPVLHDMLGLYDAKFIDYNTCREVLKNIHLLGIAEDLIKKIKTYRDENHVLLIPDITSMLNNLISANDAPFIYEKTGSTFYHFLIDEFQDTSVTQWKNLQPLISHSLSEGNFAMIVGDAKQAIYRWRKGDSRLLLEGVRKSLKPFDEIISEKILGTNYRSKAEIVNFNNRFFTSSKEIVVSQLKGEGIEEVSIIENTFAEKDIFQTIHKGNEEGGFVEFRFIPKGEKEDEELLHWKDEALLRMLDTLEEVRFDGFGFSDIAILVRSNAEGARITQFLFENGITEIVSPDSLMLSASPKILFLVSIFYSFNNPQDEIAKTHILHFYEAYLKNKTIDPASIFNLNAGKGNSLFISVLPESFTLHIPHLRKLPLYELTEHLIRIFQLNEKPDAFLLRFQDVVFDFTRRDSSGISDFLEWWEENKESEKCSLLLPENKTALTIMSIHKSKGLQFPVVLIPFLDWDLGPGTNKREMIWVDPEQEPYKKYSPLPLTLNKQLGNSQFKKDYDNEITLSYLDNLNVLYVAFTRPEERLYVFCSGKEYKKASSTGALVSFVLQRENNGLAEAPNKDRVWMTGIKSKKSEKKEKKSRITTELLPETLSNPWSSKISISSKGKRRMETFTLDDSNELSGANYGLLVHDILKDIRTKDDIPKALTDLRFEGIVEAEEMAILKVILEKLVSDKETAFVFSPDWEITTEKDILLGDGNILRPDRILTKGKQAILVDYKTNAPDGSHVEQLSGYSAVLKQMGFTEVRKYLLYIHKYPVSIELQEITE